MAPLRLIFFGTAELACPSLIALTERSEFQVLAVVTQPDRPRGRQLKLQPSPVKAAAAQRNLPVLQPERARRPEFVAELAAYQPYLIVVAAYGQILPPAILDLPKFGCINVHTSLLPKYRGAAPIQWAILEDQSETGVTIMKMDPGLDTGDILTQQATPIRPEDDSQTLHDRLATIGAELLTRTIPEYVAGKVQPRPQDHAQSSYARKITKEDGRLDWRQPNRVLWNKVRGLSPWPGSWTLLPQPTTQPLLKIWRAEPADAGAGTPGEVIAADKTGIIVTCAQGALRIKELQRESSRRVTAQDFLAGHPLQPGDHLG
jgi:methionyl-tRNA formyltransferase